MNLDDHHTQTTSASAATALRPLPPSPLADQAEAVLSAYRGRSSTGFFSGAARAFDDLVREVEPELLDLESTPPAVRQQIIEDVHRLNAWFRIYSIALRRLGPLLRSAARRHPGRPVRVLDVGTGHGGLLFAIHEWARRHRIRVELAGCDVAAPILDVARRAAAERGVRLELFVGDVRRLDEIDDGEFDIAMFTLALHHLHPVDAARALLELDRVSSQSLFVLDLERSAARLPFLWLLLKATVWAPSRHDGVRSMRRAYTADELRLLGGAAGLGIDVARVMPGLVVATRGGPRS
jgi:SAM-dependent methyltransferase